MELFKITCILLKFFASQWLLPHVTIVEIMDSGERGMNPVAITIVSQVLYSTLPADIAQ